MFITLETGESNVRLSWHCGRGLGGQGIGGQRSGCCSCSMTIIHVDRTCGWVLFNMAICDWACLHNKTWFHPAVLSVSHHHKDVAYQPVWTSGDILLDSPRSRAACARLIRPAVVCVQGAICWGNHNRDRYHINQYRVMAVCCRHIQHANSADHW